MQIGLHGDGAMEPIAHTAVLQLVDRELQVHMLLHGAELLTDAHTTVIAEGGTRKANAFDFERPRIAPA